MTTITQTPAKIFAEAHEIHHDALKLLTAGDIRNAAGNAWQATLRSTDALILAWTGEEPIESSVTTRMLRECRVDLRNSGSPDLFQRIDDLVLRYGDNRNTLYGICFYLGLCEPLDDTEQMIRDTINYIHEAEALANGPIPAGLRPR